MLKLLMTVLVGLIEALMENLSPEKAREVADGLLDKVEDAIVKSDNKWDDLLLPVIRKMIREPFGIEDNDNG